jgi:Mg-chelatase subunit ChlD
MALAASLLAGAGLWVALLAATSGGPTAAPPPLLITGGAQADRAAIKFVDKASFFAADSTGEHSGEITLRLDVVDKTGQPVADLRTEDVRVLEADLPGRIKFFRGPASQAVNVILVLDVSGSMAQQGRIGGARRASHAALNALKTDRDRIGLIAFDDRFEFRVPFDRLSEEHRQKCGRRIDELRPRAGTAIGPPVLAALRKFGETKPDGLKMVLLMTDGDDNDRDRFARQREQIADLSDQLGVQVHSISVGNEVSQDGEEDLRDLAAKGKGRYEHAPAAERLADLFRSRVAETLNECTLVYDSPYPKADGFDRPITVTIRTPAGPLTATASYKIGPLLSGRSEPAQWALAAPAAANGAAPAPRLGGGIRGPLFACLLAGLLAALALPALRRKSAVTDPPPESATVNVPQSIRPPPPPPGRASVPPTSAPVRETQSVNIAAPRPSSGSVLKPPPPPPSKKS